MSTAALPKHRLRVLSGHHAGAEILLLSCSSLSASRSSDLRLRDWHGAELRILRPDGETVWWSDAPHPPYMQSAKAWENWSPLRLGGVVLVHGPDGPWPSDEELWSRWLKAKGGPSVHGRLRRLMPGLGGVAALLVVGSLFAATWNWSGKGKSMRPAQSAELAHEIRRLPRARMHLELALGTPSRLSGWVTDASDREAVQQLLARHPEVDVVQEFRVTGEIRQALATALGPSVQVESSGGEQFVLTGEVASLIQTRVHLVRTLSELGLKADHVVDHLRALSERSRPFTGTSLNADSLRYELQPDGSRWIQLKPWNTPQPNIDQRSEFP